jgi:DNA-binding protein HU-beta
MTRVTKQDATTNVGRMDHQATGDNQSQAAGEDAFSRQANKGILADKVAQELNVPRRTAARVLDAVLDSMRDLLRARGKVAVKGFGTFERRIRKGRAYKHPLTGVSIDVANKETVIFKPSDQLIVETRSNAAPRPRKPQGNPTDDILFKG